MFWLLCLGEVTNIQANYHLDFILELYSVGCVSCFCTKRMHHCSPILWSIIIFKWFMVQISCLGDEVNIHVNYHLDFILELYNDSLLFQFFLPNSVMENVAPHQIVISEVINAIINVMIEIPRIPCYLRIQKTLGFIHSRNTSKIFSIIVNI